MKKALQRFAICAIAFNLSGCISAPRNPIDGDARAYIDTVELFLAVPQDEIFARVKESTVALAMGGGLLPALIDLSVNKLRTKNQEEAIAPIRDALIGYDFADVLSGHITKQLDRIEWFEISDFELLRSAAEDRYDREARDAAASAVLFLAAEYAIAADFKSLETSVDLVMLPGSRELYDYAEKPVREDKPMDRSNNIYRNRLSVNLPFGISGDRDEVVRHLVDSDAALLKRILRDSATRLATLIVEDLRS